MSGCDYEMKSFRVFMTRPLRENGKAMDYDRVFKKPKGEKYPPIGKTKEK